MTDLSNDDIPDWIEVPEDESTKLDILNTVEYVHRNGTAFEAKLNLDKTKFVLRGNKYYDYYSFILERKRSSQNAESNNGKETENRPLEPYPFVFSTYRNDVGKKDLDLIKATAHFCAINSGVDYLEKLRAKYSSDSRFAFLRHDHSLNPVLTEFINQYEQISAGEYGPLADIKGPIKKILLFRAFQRAQSQEFQDELKYEMRETSKRLRIRFSAYQWNKFELVERITFSEEDEKEGLPSSVDFEHLKRTKLTQDISIFKERKEDKTTTKRKRKNMVIKKAGETRLQHEKYQNNFNEQNIKCPITGKLIPESQFDEHLRTLLSDPQYKEEKEKYESKHRLTNLTTTEVYENIKKLVYEESSVSNKKQKTK